MIDTLKPYVKGYGKESILSPIFISLEVLMEILIPYVTARIIDYGIQGANMSEVYKYGIVMLVMAFFGLCFGALAGKFAATASAGLARNLRKGMYDNIQTFSFSNIDKFSSAGLITRMTTDVTNVQNAYGMILRLAFRAPLNFIIAMIMCFTINVKISLMFLAALAVLIIVMLLMMGTVTGLFKKVFRRYDDLNASAQENISGIRVVKAYVREEYETSKFVKAVNNVYKLFVKADGLMAAAMPLMMGLIFGLIILISWFAAHYIVAGDMMVGDLTALFSYILTCFMSLMMLAMVVVMITMASASANRIAEVLNEKADIVDPENPIETVPDGSIDFVHVDFSYMRHLVEETTDDRPDIQKKMEQKKAERKAKKEAKKQGVPYEPPLKNEDQPVPVLHDINLHIESGKTIGLIGATGCGKSSLVNLISRLYDTTNGEVRVGGHNVKEYAVEPLRDAVSVVLQKNELFTGSILENLRWGNENATEEECRKACELACADEFIDKMPKGYDTHIERGGTNVSGGQKQRLCIARALLKNPKILILDDSTSAVDTATDAKIRKAFREEIPNTTKIIISQRISSVQDADKIIVMDKGRIDGFGSHEELLETNTIYREIYQTQQKGSGDFDEVG